jgi:hypothetical protein
MAGEGQREGRREGGRSDRRPELIVLVTIDVELLRVEDVLIRGLNLSDGFVVNINFFLFGIDAFLHQHQLVEDLGNRLSKKMSMDPTVEQMVQTFWIAFFSRNNEVISDSANSLSERRLCKPVREQETESVRS